MGLYLCVWEESDEVDGVDVGSYADYGRFVDPIIEHVEAGKRGSKCPIITMHSDSDGQWALEECARLKHDLEWIQRVFSSLPPAPIPAGWQTQVAKTLGIKPATLADSFFDIDGEQLIGRLIGLCQIAVDSRRGILFQ